MRDPMMLLITAIEHTKQLWEVYKTEEIRVYLEYLKGLYDRELEKLEKQCTLSSHIYLIVVVCRLCFVWFVCGVCWQPPRNWTENTNKLHSTECGVF